MILKRGTEDLELSQGQQEGLGSPSCQLLVLADAFADAKVSKNELLQKMAYQALVNFIGQHEITPKIFKESAPKRVRKAPRS